ncbi:hypothetical protein BN77_p10187 [Rhizobium mesoamericanum STM3625]|uniref:Uncharacterized protein n=1 Tax=Rhizobium mesoamericanum STM3625 TaxID=1211777 RepID=K0Q1R8_9HYPH|nr:hypothetical protein BN77_p10187 [Rhizobium mesoamericanum STM3625]
MEWQAGQTSDVMRLVHAKVVPLGPEKRGVIWKIIPLFNGFLGQIYSADAAMACFKSALKRK